MDVFSEAELVLDSALIDAITKIERRWSRNPERWDAAFDQLLSLQVAFEEGTLPFGEICWLTRNTLLELGFVFQANKLGKACRDVPWDTPVNVLPPIEEASGYDLPPQPQPPPEPNQPSLPQRATATVHQVSQQLAEDDGAPLLGLGGLFFGLAAAVRLWRRR